MQTERLVCAHCSQPIGEREGRVQRSTDGATVHQSCPEPEGGEWEAAETSSGNGGGGKA